MKPPTAPSIVFFGLSRGASGWRPKRAAGVVLRGVADGNGRDQQHHRTASAENVHADQRPERQAQIHDRRTPAGNGTVNARLERLTIRRRAS